MIDLRNVNRTIGCNGKIALHRVVALQRAVRTALEQAEQSKIISRAIEYVSEHLTEPITLDGISNALYTNKYYFAHLFKEETGVSPHSYILKKRLLMSKELIEQGLSITDVYVRCGFSDYTHFFRAFKKEFDLTPKQYFHLMKAI